MTSTHRHNAINYIEFPSNDPAAIRSFYSAVFGWSFQDYGPDYLAFNDGQLDGGFSRALPVTTGGPLVVLYAKDLETARNNVTENGGVIVKDIFAFPGGRRFHFTDPDGNVLAVWSE